MNNKKNKRIKTIVIIISLICVLVSAYVFTYPSVFDYNCKTRHYEYFENADYIIIPYGAPTYSEYSKNSESHISYEDYYGQFEKAQLEFADEEYDLAVISFKSEKALNVLSISEKNPKYNEKIMVISNPEGERFVQSYGKIKSRDYYVFESDDELSPVDTFKHNAYIRPGSSGSAVLNQEMEIVGINIGGSTDFMDRFRYGAMVPCELINEFLEKNKRR